MGPWTLMEGISSWKHSRRLLSVPYQKTLLQEVATGRLHQNMLCCERKATSLRHVAISNKNELLGYIKLYVDITYRLSYNSVVWVMTSHVIGNSAVCLTVCSVSHQPKHESYTLIIRLPQKSLSFLLMTYWRGKSAHQQRWNGPSSRRILQHQQQKGYNLHSCVTSYWRLSSTDVEICQISEGLKNA